MNDNTKLVTLAIHSFDNASALQRRLEENGIESVLQPVGSSDIIDSVRVRVSEADLPAAVSLVESLKAGSAPGGGSAGDTVDGGGRDILLPTDFDSLSSRSFRFAFELASKCLSRVVFIHAFSVPVPRFSIIDEVIGGEKVNREKLLQQALDSLKVRQQALSRFIDAEILAGRLAAAPYVFQIRRGVPEEVILDYSLQASPLVTVMCSRNHEQKEADFTGSITAEIIERSKNPVLAIPGNSKLDAFDDVKRIAFATRFEDEDLNSFSQLMKLMQPYRFDVRIIHIPSDRDDSSPALNDIKLRGICNFFSEKYPGIDFQCCMLPSGDVVDNIVGYVNSEAVSLLVLSIHQRSRLVRLFNPSLAKRLMLATDIPLLAFHA